MNKLISVTIPTSNSEKTLEIAGKSNVKIVRKIIGSEIERFPIN